MNMEVLEYKTYEEFLDDLKPNRQLDIIRRKYIFRGQSGDWPLLPLALRTTDKNKLSLFAFTNGFNLQYAPIELVQRTMEYNVLLKFYRYANTIGLKLPDTLFSSVEYSYPENLKNFEKEDVINEWLPDGLQEIAALAQHYGLPTRLLDWTFDISVALYFASYNAVKDKVASTLYPEAVNDDLVIWGINYFELERAHSLHPQKSPPIRFVIPHYSDNPNIFAQKGILSFWKSDPLELNNDVINKVCRTPLDKMLENFKYDSGFLTDSPVIYKILIPASEALKIFKHISICGYNATTIFPGYNGVKNKMEEEVMIKQAESIYKNLFSQKSTICCATSARGEQNNINVDTTGLKNAPEQDY